MKKCTIEIEDDDGNTFIYGGNLISCQIENIDKESPISWKSAMGFLDNILEHKLFKVTLVYEKQKE